MSSTVNSGANLLTAKSKGGLIIGTSQIMNARVQHHSDCTEPGAINQ